MNERTAFEDSARSGAPAATAVSVHGVRKAYPTRDGELVVLRDVSLELAAGDAVAIMGPSGSGKSTLLNILGALDAPTAGRVCVGGVEPFALPADELARFRNRYVGFVFQDHHLLAPLSAFENVLLPTLAGGRMEDDSAGGDPEPRARALLDRVGLSQRLDHRPAELSGGERQRVAIARALINRPAVLLADEPTGNLDRKAAESVAELLLEVQREENVALVVVTHSEQLAARLPRRYEMVDGMLVNAE